ncbi:Protein of unknown function [Pyronema omphalodes CBS 100304]|uniref:Uncharacterized protein n=1 Tax=Pyronema omphalodes (strain CBS 100304) TaxID=1076935 RepID=U4LL42_PYROM|nr:Protein of unknown function [Pyronema omphalodes CBS 100304]
MSEYIDNTTDTDSVAASRLPKAPPDGVILITCLYLDYTRCGSSYPNLNTCYDFAKTTRWLNNGNHLL